MTSEGFTGISIKTNFVERIRKLIGSEPLKGRYKNITEFITEATRLRLEELEKQYQNAQETAVLPIAQEA